MYNIYAYWNEIGYTNITTFWEDFSIADRFVGVEDSPIEDTYKRALKYAKTDYKVFTELVLVLNHKIWEWYKVNDYIGKIYDKLWKQSEDEFYKTFEGNEEATHYFFETTD